MARDDLRPVVGHPFQRYCPVCGQPAYIDKDGRLADHLVKVVRQGRPRGYRLCGEGGARSKEE